MTARWFILALPPSLPRTRSACGRSPAPAPNGGRRTRRPDPVCRLGGVGVGTKTDLIELSANDARAQIARGAISAVEYTQAFLDRVAAVEKDVQAFIQFDPDYALKQARTLDAHRANGLAVGPVHGIPVAIKDIFDTKDFPTGYGSLIYAGHRPGSDSAAVARLRAAGAVIIGKTVTTEFAYFHPGKTRNPHGPTRTPGGSSSGSAAAVAAGMAPLAVGSQTKGSGVPPAPLFCGVCAKTQDRGLFP